MNIYLIMLAIIGAFAVADIYKMIAGPTIFDRLLCLNILSAKIVMAMTIFALMTGQSYMLDIAIVYTLLSFVSTVLIARFVRSRGMQL
ncbi:MAG: monovalent cation/H+ antiporter complex subunit F [Eubacteriales bacterium]|nr:monovalent cation/H+ antiporter complex subunit F [Eubacteriales bacterium]